MKHILLFLTIAFGISWLAALGIYLSGIEYGKLFSTVIVAVFYMPAPAIAAFLMARFVTKESMADFGLSFNNVKWKWVFLTPLIFAFCFSLQFGTVYLLGNIGGFESFGTVDFSMTHFAETLMKLQPDLTNQQLSKIVEKMNFPLYLLLPVILLTGAVSSFTVNAPFMLGEELGWRGFLLKHTAHWGFFRSNLFIGIVWGLWHAPIILMGHNYPEHPQWGVLMMVVFCTALAFVFSLVRIKTNSIWGPVVLHGMVNSTAASFGLFIAGGIDLHMAPTGLAAIPAWILTTAIVLLMARKQIKLFFKTGSAES